MRYYLLFVFFMSVSFLYSKTKFPKKILIENLSDIVRSDEMVELDISPILAELNKNSNLTYVVKDSLGKVVPSQITYNRKLIFVVTLQPKSRGWYSLNLAKDIYFEPKVYGRVYPERKNDISWENDRVAFRFYGDTLKYIDGPSNALDLWFKRTDKLILDKWYHDDIVNKVSFHIDHGEGCDPYAVGHSLGAGAMAPLIDGKLILNSNYLKAIILDEGPLRFTARLIYPDIEIRGRKCTETRIVSLDAGSQLTKITEEYSFDKPMTLAAGIIKRTGNDSILVNKSGNYFIYEEPADKINGQLYVGVIIPQGVDRVFVNSYDYDHPLLKERQHFNHVIGATQYTPFKSVIYYAGYGWTKSGFENVSDFERYMNFYSLKIQQPLVVKVVGEQ